MYERLQTRVGLSYQSSLVIYILMTSAHSLGLISLTRRFEGIFYILSLTITDAL